MSWKKLPQDLKERILTLVANDELAPTTKDSSGKPVGRVARYTGVSREWQMFFEKITFRHFSVNLAGLLTFDRLTGGYKAYRRDYVRDMSFTILLPGYSCLRCHQPENSTESVQNNAAFTISMKTLLSVLSTWAPKGGLTLELNIKSWADIHHSSYTLGLYDDCLFEHWNWQDRFALISLYAPKQHEDFEPQCSPPKDKDDLSLACPHQCPLERRLGSLL